MEHSSEDAPIGEVAVEMKIPLQTMGPFPTAGTIAEIPPPPSSALAMVLSLPNIGAPGLSLTTDVELDEELQ